MGLCFRGETAAAGIASGMGGGRGGGSDGCSFVGYSDADWAGDPVTRRSTTAFAFLCNHVAIAWCSKRQKTVAASTVEAVYQAGAAAAREALWLRKLAADLDLEEGAIPINIDNQGALSVARNPVTSSHSKHIDVHHHLLRERVARGEVAVRYCPTELMVADILTKALPANKFCFCRAAMGVA